MTKMHPVKSIRKILLSLGFRFTHKCDGTHELWCNAQGRRVRPRIGGVTEVHRQHLVPLGDSLAANGICSRQEFINAVRAC